MREELDRNAGLLEAKTVADIPHLLANAKTLAVKFEPDPRYLLANQQREALIPDLLISFLTVQLVDTGWHPSYSAESGLTLHSDTRVINPFELIHGLAEKTIDHHAFISLTSPQTPPK
jgi:hypothetical protein